MNGSELDMTTNTVNTSKENEHTASRYIIFNSNEFVATENSR